MAIDLNADVGESFGAYAIGQDAGLMRSISSASVAAGFHGGDPTVLRRTIRLARDAGVALGAHPGFPDLSGFGRREMRIPADELEDLVLFQIAAVAGVAAAEGVGLQHVKPHGALYNMAAQEATLAASIARAVVCFDPSLILFGPPASALEQAARDAGLAFAREAFADRAYEPDGSLTPRALAGSIIDDADGLSERAVRLVRDRVVLARDGTRLSLEADSLCVHSDTPDAARLAAQLRAALERAGIEIRPVGAR